MQWVQVLLHAHRHPELLQYPPKSTMNLITSNSYDNTRAYAELEHRIHPGEEP